ncbi:MAG: hypothetical protein JWL72_3295 [Ilumatobacteraceae bacterium]|nr:hypothetical protein [Ilumatobacteraceae bacterium]
MSVSVDDEPMFALPDLESFRALRGAARDQAFMVIQVEKRRIAALEAAIITDVRTSVSYLDDRHHSVNAWVQAVTNCSRSAANQRVRAAAMLAELPDVAEAYAEGTVGDDQVNLLAGLHASPRCRDKLPDSQAELLEAARTQRARDFTLTCQRWEAANDPDGTMRDQEACRENRKISFAGLGAGFLFRAEGDALTGDMIREILRGHAEAELETDLAERSAIYGDHAAEHALARSPEQRAFDAFASIFFKGAGTNGTTERKPLIIIHCTPSVLTQAIREYFGTSTPPEEPSERFRLCETSSGAPVSLRDLAVAALIGKVQRIVSAPNGLTINLGRSTRLFTGSARDAVLLANDRCCWPGCGMRTGRIQVDHMSPWVALTGVTDPLNGAPMCGIHNRAKHNGNFTVKRDNAGWHLYRPDGTEVAPCGHG